MFHGIGIITPSLDLRFDHFLNILEFLKHSENGDKGNGEMGIRNEDTIVSDRLKEVMRGLVFTKDELAYLDAQTNTRVLLLEERRTQELAEIERAKKAIREVVSTISV